MQGTWRLRQWIARRRLAHLTRLAESAVVQFPATRLRARHELSGRLIVNLTSHPPRFPRLAWTLRSLLDQKIMADATILWLAPEELEVLPEEVHALSGWGLEVRTCANLRSYKKLIPALGLWPDAFHVTADDDVYYPPDWLAGLVQAHRAAPSAVIAWRAHLVRIAADGRIRPYLDWELATARTEAPPGAALFPTGVGGVLYPPGSLHPEVLAKEHFLQLCPRGDDIWFYWMARRQGSVHRRTAGWLDLIEWPDTQQVGLRVENLEASGNDQQIHAMEMAYGPFPR